MIDDLVGIPHAQLDCYDLACAVAERFGRRVPAIDPQTVSRFVGVEGLADARDCVTDDLDRVEIGSEQAGDLVLMFRHRRSKGVEHIGVVTAPGRVIHSLAGRASRIDRLDDLISIVDSIWRLPQC